MSTRTQSDAILALLRERGERGVTPLDALELVGSFRLGARIWELKAEGHHIVTEWVHLPGGKRCARYVLHESRPFAPDNGEQMSWQRLARRGP